MKNLILAATIALAPAAVMAHEAPLVFDLGCRVVKIFHHEGMTEAEIQLILEKHKCKPKVMEPNNGDEDHDGRDDYNSPTGDSECSGGSSDGVGGDDQDDTDDTGNDNSGGVGDDDATGDDAGDDTGDTDTDAGGNGNGGNNGGNPCGGNCGNGQGNGGGNGTGNEGNGNGPNN